jgi:A/G-specific adenine glycosylase
MAVRQTRMLLIFDDADRLLLEQRAPSGVWGGLWVPPELPSGASGGDGQPDGDAEQWCRARLGSAVRSLEMLPPRRHTFSHFHLDIQPLVVRLASGPNRVADRGRELWIDASDPDGIGLPAPIRRLLAEAAERVGTL